MKNITLRQAQEKIKFNQRFKKVYNKNKLKITLGVVCLIIAIFPNGLGFIFYPLGFICLGIKKETLLKKVEDVKFKIKGY